MDERGEHKRPLLACDLDRVNTRLSRLTILGWCPDEERKEGNVNEYISGCFPCSRTPPSWPSRTPTQHLLSPQLDLTLLVDHELSDALQ